MNKPPTSSKKPLAPRGQGQRPGTSAAARRIVATRKKRDRGAEYAWWIGGALVVLLLLLVAAGYYNDNIGPGRDAALRVGTQSVSLTTYRDRLKAQTVINGAGSQQDAARQESTVTDNLEEEQVYLQRAWSLDVTASEDEIAAQIAQIARVAVKNGKVVDQGLYDFAVRGYLQRSGLSVGELREQARAAVLKQKVIDHFKAGLPAQALAIKGTQFIFDSADAASAAQQELETGASVADLAAELQANPTKGQATPLDWTFVPYGVLPRSLDVAASQLQVGQVTGAIEVAPPTPNGSPQYELLAISDRDPQHALDAAAQPALANGLATNWYNQQRDALGVHSFIDGSRALWAIQHTGLPLAAPSPTATAPGNPGVPGGVPSIPGSNGPGSNAPGTGPGSSAPGGAGPQPPAPAQPSAPAAPNATP